MLSTPPRGSNGARIMMAPIAGPPRQVLMQGARLVGLLALLAAATAVDAGATEDTIMFKPKSPGTPTQPAISAGGATTLERLQAYYKRYNPKKLKNVPKLLREYKGREDTLFDKLHKQYGHTIDEATEVAAQNLWKQELIAQNSLKWKPKQHGHAKADKTYVVAQNLWKQELFEQIKQQSNNVEPPLVAEVGAWKAQEGVVQGLNDEGDEAIEAEDDDAAPQQEEVAVPREVETTTGVARPFDRSLGGVPIRWLHIPKTGTTFAITLLRFMCLDAGAPGASLRASASSAKKVQDLVGHLVGASAANQRKATAVDRSKAIDRAVRDINTFVRLPDACPLRSAIPGGKLSSHRPLDPAVTAAVLRDGDGGGTTPPAVLVGFFRDPARRAVSDFYYTAVDANGAKRKQGSFGMPGDTIKRLHAELGELGKGGGGGGVTPRVQRFLRWPGIASCQAKLLLGRECHARGTVTPDDAARAAAIVEKGFAFVGITEEWDASVCIFHARFGGPPAVDAERRVLRATDHGSDGEGLYHGVRLGDLRGADEADEAVYAAARRVFERDRALLGC